MPTGTVNRIFSDRAFGFITEDEPTSDRGLFFHKNDLLPALEFGPHLEQMRVEFEIGTGRKGACAKNLRAAT